MNEFEALIQNVGYAGREVKHNTLRKIAGDLEKLYGTMYEIDENFHWKKYRAMLMDYEQVLEAIDEMKGRKSEGLSLNTKISYLQSCLTGLKSFGLEDTVAFEDLNTTFINLQTERIIQGKKEPPSLEIDRKAVEEIVEKYKDHPKTWILLKLYTIYNFRLEVATLEQISEEEFSEDIPHLKLRNFIVTGKNLRFVFNKYKTSGKYGTRTIMIEKGEFSDALEKFLGGRDKSEFVFFEPNWEKIEEEDEGVRRDKVFTRLANNLSKFVQRTFKKHGLDLNATKLAKLIESEAWATGDPNLIAKVANQRGHLIETAGKVYDIVNK